MIKVAQDTTRRLLDIHGWSGVLLGLALYVVVFTGSIVVFTHEIGVWSASGNALEDVLSQSLDAKLIELAEQVPEQYREEAGIWQNSAGHIIANFHTHEKQEKGPPREIGTRFVIDPNSLEVISKHEGYLDEMPVISSGALEEFFVHLHINLHAPDPIGLYLTGILGLVLLISAISGVILHRHLIKDMFLSPRLSNRLLNTRDRHNLAGTWGVPFSIILAFTGAFFSFATTLGLPVIAMTAFGGDQEKAIETIIGIPPAEDPTPSAFIGIDTIVAQAKQEEIAGSSPRFISVLHWGRADAAVLTTHSPSPENIFFSNHRFDGVSGEYLGEKPTLGTESSAGGVLFGLMRVLHFGWFAGLLSKIIWISLGLATCYVTLTGLQLWVQRREAKTSWNTLSALISIIGYGTPIAMISAALGFFIASASLPDRMHDWTVDGFLIGSALSFLIGFLFYRLGLAQRVFQQITGFGLLLLPIVRIITSGQGWGTNLATGNGVVVGMDIAFLFTGILFLALSFGVVREKVFSKEARQSDIEMSDQEKTHSPDQASLTETTVIRGEG